MRKRAAVISYDIVCNRRRRRVFRCLQSWSLDAQYSVFECRLTTSDAQELFLELVDLIDEDEDMLLLAWVDPRREALAVTKAAKLAFRDPSSYLG